MISREDYSVMIDMTDPSLIHDYSEQNTCEDMFMMAFFDSLVQQELETWNTNSINNSEPNSSNSSRSSGSSLSTSSSSDESECGLKIKFKCNPQRNKFPNRIAYLIAQKRYTLRRLAMQALMNRRRYRGKNGRFARGRGYHSTTSSSSRFKRKRGSKRYSSRGTQFPNTVRGSEYPHNTFSNDDEDDSSQSEQGLKPFDSKRSVNSYSSAESDSENDRGASSSQRNNVNLAIPSTSTGITSNGKSKYY